MPDRRLLHKDSRDTVLVFYSGFLEGQGDLVNILMTPINHIETQNYVLRSHFISEFLFHLIFCSCSPTNKFLPFCSSGISAVGNWGLWLARSFKREDPHGAK